MKGLIAIAGEIIGRRQVVMDNPPLALLNVGDGTEKEVVVYLGGMFGDAYRHYR